MDQKEPRGVLNYQKGRKNYRLNRLEPSSDLTPFIEVFWFASWELPYGKPHSQQNIPHPNVHLVIESNRSEIVGVVTRKYTRMLEGKGSVIGVKFHPGGFYPFLKQPVSIITDTTLNLEQVFGAQALEQEVLAQQNHVEQQVVLESFLRQRLSRPDKYVDKIKLAREVVDWISQNPMVTRVEQIAEHFRIPLRNLQRLFKTMVGVSPKWVIKKYRIHQALDHLEQGQVKWTDLAIDLGYFDQAHFMKEFQDLIGVSPGVYMNKN